MIVGLQTAGQLPGRSMAAAEEGPHVGISWCGLIEMFDGKRSKPWPRAEAASHCFEDTHGIVATIGDSPGGQLRIGARPERQGTKQGRVMSRVCRAAAKLLRNVQFLISSITLHLSSPK
jgi:hypothetical protein